MLCCLLTHRCLVKQTVAVAKPSTEASTSSAEDEGQDEMDADELKVCCEGTPARQAAACSVNLSHKSCPIIRRIFLQCCALAEVEM